MVRNLYLYFCRVQTCFSLEKNLCFPKSLTQPEILKHETVPEDIHRRMQSCNNLLTSSQFENRQTSISK